MKKKIEIAWGIGHLCLVITLIMLVWNNLYEVINSFNIFFKVLFLLITGIGAIMIYVFMGFMLQDLKKVIFKEENKTITNGNRTRSKRT